MGSAATIQRPGTPTGAALQNHLPSLDGMRALSILLVLAQHAYETRVNSSVTGISYWGYLGRLGVFVFFVISGLLITWLMIREREATGAFSLRYFYLRRFLRILPVFWLLILTVTALKTLHIISIGWIDIARALTFTHNYPISFAQPVGAWWLGHTWSLSVEEQFYLFWPSLFALAPRRLIPRLTVILALCGPVLRILSYFLFPSMRGWDANGFESLVDLLMAGCVSAFLLDSAVWRKRIRSMPVWPTLAVTVVSLMVVVPSLTNHLRAHSLPSTIANLLMPTFQAAMIALALLVLVAGEEGHPFRVLNSRIAMHIGRLSYSLYIWQQLFLPPRSAAGALPLLWRLPAVYLVAFSSFYFAERPLLRLRSRFRRGTSV